jgi:hypothetical protein
MPRKTLAGPLFNLFAQFLDRVGHMFPQCVQTGIRNPHLRYTVSWLVAAVLTLQSLTAADAWSRVTRLKVGEDFVYVALTSGERKEGRFLAADIAGITILPVGQGDITVARYLVLQVAIERIEKKQKRRWFSIPLTVAAAAAGAFVGYKTAGRHFKCSNKPDGERKACEQVGALIVIGSAAAPAAATYALTTRGQSKKGIKVIYDKPSARTHRRK